jgi:hypothetical protein
MVSRGYISRLGLLCVTSFNLSDSSTYENEMVQTHWLVLPSGVSLRLYHLPAVCDVLYHRVSSD